MTFGFLAALVPFTRDTEALRCALEFKLSWLAPPPTTTPNTLFRQPSSILGCFTRRLNRSDSAYAARLVTSTNQPQPPPYRATFDNLI